MVMEGFQSSEKISEDSFVETTEHVYHALNPNREKEILAKFTSEQQEEIRQKQQTLSSLAYFIGKDFRIPVLLNEPGGGWYWNFEKNEIRIDPKTLLESSVDELRYLMCHEGGHRRVSRTEFIPLEEWRQPGFSAMMNFIEDPRNDNFVAESYPKYRENIDVAWSNFFEKEKKKLEEMAMDRLGTKPRFMQAGYEYIRQWFREIHGEKFDISKDLPEEVKAVVLATLESAQDSWWRYPSREEADKSESLIKKYAELSYRINRDQVWPEFKKLIEQDLEDQKMEELLKDMQREKDGGDGEKSEKGLPQELKDKLTPEEQKALEEVIKKAIEEAKKESSDVKAKEDKQAETESKVEGSEEAQSEKANQPSPRQDLGESGKPIPLDSLPQGLKQKIKDYIDSLSPDEQKEIKNKAEKAFKEFEDALNEELQGKLSEDPIKKAERESKETDIEEKIEQAHIGAGERVTGGKVSRKPADIAGMRVFSEKLAQEVGKNENVYEEYRMEVLPLIDKLENELRAIFTERKTTSWKSGFKSGKRIDVGKRIQEKAKVIPAMESRSWQRRKMPDEKDYAISLLVDTSGSMYWDEKSKESLKSIIILAEVLNRLGINIEILGFNDEMQEYQNFGQEISKKIREHIGEILQEVERKKCDVCKFDHNATDIGWATEVASERLSRQKEENKFLITLSDYQIEESSKHPTDKYELGKITKKVLGKSDTHIIGLKLGGEGGDISTYYPYSISGVNAKEMAEKLADLIKEVVANYDKF